MYRFLVGARPEAIEVQDAAAPGRCCDVIHIVNELRPGGIETMVLDLVRRSNRRSRIFSLDGSRQDLVCNWPALETIARRIEGFERSPGVAPRLAAGLARRLRALAPEVVFLHHIGPLLYGGVAARLAGVPRLVHVEHDVWHYASERHRKLLRWSSRLLRPAHLAVSSHVADTLRAMLPGALVSVVPAGVDTERFSQRERAHARSELMLPTEAPVIGTAGRLEPVKGHSVLIEAMRHVPDDVLCVIAGQGSEQARLARLARQLGLESRVRFLGHRDDLERVLPALDAFCLPSLREGLPRAVMEAQAADVPVIVSELGSIRDVVSPATGTLVPAGDVGALAAAIARCIADPPPRGLTRSFAEANFPLAPTVAAFDSFSIGAGHAA